MDADAPALQPNVIEQEDPGHPPGGFPISVDTYNFYQQAINNYVLAANRWGFIGYDSYANTMHQINDFGAQHANSPEERLLNKCVKAWVRETMNEHNLSEHHYPFHKIVCPSVRNLYLSYRHRVPTGGGFTSESESVHKRFR